ncbi:hypothetical protein V2J09_003023 [Rumex salicifolius]
MNWCRKSNAKSDSGSNQSLSPPQESHVNHQQLMQIPGCTVHLMDDGEAAEIAGPGDLTILCVTDDSLSLAITIKVGDNLQWPLTKDQPVVKLDDLHYLFTIPVNGGDPLSYGIGFSEQSKGFLVTLDSFLQQNSCFSFPFRSLEGTKNGSSCGINWMEFAPMIEDYNHVLARVIAGGTGQIIKGIFMCSNAYTNQVQKGGELLLDQATEDKKGANENAKSLRSGDGRTKKTTSFNKNLKRVRKLSIITEKMSKAMLDGLGVASGSVMGTLVRSKTGQAFFSMMPGEVVLASLDAIDRILNAAEAAEKQALRATSEVTVRHVSNKYGESAGEATEHALATAGHCAGTAWNVFKIRKAIMNPAASVSSGLLKSTQTISLLRHSKP